MRPLPHTAVPHILGGEVVWKLVSIQHCLVDEDRQNSV